MKQITMKNILIFVFGILLVGCMRTKLPKDQIPTHDTVTLASTKVNENRVINIWTPPGYETSNIAYPVLYMADGGIKEDFPHIANTLEKLIMEKSIPPFILVGIENTDRRRDLSGFSETEYDKQFCPLTDGAKDFRAFIMDELLTEIEAKYRVTSKKGIIGESLSGLFVMETFMLTPEAFDYYIAFDPSLWWNNHYLVRNAEQLLEKFPEQKKRLWFAGSSVPDISLHTNELSRFLEKKAPKNLTWTYSDEPNEKHSTIFRATKEKALIWCLNE